MFDRLVRSWHLVKASTNVLRADPELLLFPLISGLAALVVMASFALPVFGLNALGHLSGGTGNLLSASALLVGFAFYVCLYFVMFYFNVALVAAAMIRFSGGDPTLSDGLRVANTKLGSILGYAVIAATVGMILRAIQERVEFLGRLIVSMLGAGWTVATYLVVPVLVTRDIGPVDAIKESAIILKKTWGENIAGQAGIGAVFGLLYLLVVLIGFSMVYVIVSSGAGAIAIGLGFLAWLVALVATALAHAALGGIYAAALYCYATGRPGVNGFDLNALNQAFAPKG